MQPKLHISAGVEYLVDPSNTSGALYQRVATPSVKVTKFSSRDKIDLTKPKSHNFIMQLELIKMFDGLRSR